MPKLTSLMLALLWSPTAFADPVPPSADPAGCFCGPPARDLSLGHFVPGGDFVVDVPLSRGPGDVMRQAGDVIDTGLIEQPAGPVLLADYGSGEAPLWCALAVGSSDPAEVTLTHGCQFTIHPNNFGETVDEVCVEPLTLEQMASLSPHFESDGRCEARARKVGLEDPNDFGGCNTGHASVLALALFLAIRRRACSVSSSR